jgi:hypothetical protein
LERLLIALGRKRVVAALIHNLIRDRALAIELTIPVAAADFLQAQQGNWIAKDFRFSCR